MGKHVLNHDAQHLEKNPSETYQKLYARYQNRVFNKNLASL